MPTRPDLNAEKVLARRDRIYEEVFISLLHVSMDSVDIQSLIGPMTAILGKGIRPDVLLEALRPVAGREFHADAAWNLAWRLAANVPAMKEGRAPHTWRVQREDERMVWQIESGEPRLNRKGMRANQFAITSLTGSYAGGSAALLLTDVAAKYVAARVGFSKRRRTGTGYPFVNPLQLVGLRFVGLTKKEDWRAPAPCEFFSSPSLVKWNRERAIDVRTRRKPCPRQFTHPCHLCAVGARECLAACHPETYVIKPCETCKQPEALHDPHQRSDRCRDCTISLNYREHMRKR